jgi:excisionase family DNA binding protein
MANNDVDRLLTTKEASEYLGLAEGTIRNKVMRNEIPYLKAGTSLRFRKAEIDLWLERERRKDVQEVASVE